MRPPLVLFVRLATQVLSIVLIVQVLITSLGNSDLYHGLDQREVIHVDEGQG